MFKKPVKIGAQNQLSGKDRKTMRNKLVTLFNEACVEKMLALNDKIISCKVSGSKMLIYNGNDYPVLVDGTAKGDYFPSLYVVQAYEPFIKCLDINEGVESFIYNGANLMWPGVRNCAELEEFKKDEVIGIRSAKGEPIAIGAMGCSFQEFQQKSDVNGVAVYILHYKGDKLWEMGPKTNPEVIIAAAKPQQKVEQQKQEPKQEEKPKEKKKNEDKEEVEEKGGKKGKKEKKKGNKEEIQEEPPQKADKQQVQVKPQKKQKQKTPEKKQKEPSSESPSEDSADDADDFMNMVHTGKKAAKKQTKVVEKKKPVVFSDEEDDKKGKKKPGKKDQKKKGKKQNKDDSQSEEEQTQKATQNKKKDKKRKDDSSDPQSNQGEQKTEEAPKSVISVKLMDQYLKQCFLNAIKISKVESELPIDSGRFYMDYMLLARPEGVKLDVKDSSYKKLGKFYDQMSKQKFIEFTKDKKGHQGATITKIFWENKQLSNYQPTVLKMGEKDVEMKEQQVTGKKKLVINRNIVVQSAYKPSKELATLLFPSTVNYAPTEEEEEAMKKQEEEAKNRPNHFSQSQIKVMIEKYINDVTKGKSKKEKVDKMVIIDYKVHPFLEDLLKKEIETFEENQEGEQDDDDDDGEEEEEKKKNKGKKRAKVFRIDRATLLNKILKKCSPSYHIHDKEGDKDVFTEGTFKGVQLIAEKSNNKNITKIIGLETFILPKSEADEQMNGFANQLQQKFACSVNIQNLPGKNAGKEIIAHGNFINELQEMLTNEYGLPEVYITSQNKLDKKKKK